MARYFDVHPENPQPRSIAQVVELLRKDAVIAYPTDSCYALGSRIDNHDGRGPHPRDPAPRRPAPLHARLRRLRAAGPAGAPGQQRVPRHQGGDPRPVHVHPAGHPRGAQAAGAREEALGRRPHPEPPGRPGDPARARRAAPVQHPADARRTSGRWSRAGRSRRSWTWCSTRWSTPATAARNRRRWSTGRKAPRRSSAWAQATRTASARATRRAELGGRLRRARRLDPPISTSDRATRARGGGTWRTSGWSGRRRADQRELRRRRGARARARQRGHVVVCGGLGGVMAAVSRGAAAAGGVVVGLLPGTDRADANPHVTVAIPTGLGELRNAPAGAVQRRRRERRRVLGNAQRGRAGRPHGRAGGGDRRVDPDRRRTVGEIDDGPRAVTSVEAALALLDEWLPR